MSRLEELDFEPSAQQVFDQFLVRRPDVAVEGLFCTGGHYYIVAPIARQDTESGRELLAWFHDELCPLGYPLELASVRPEDSEEVSARPVREIAEGFGVVRTTAHLERDLALWIPPSVPYVGMSADERGVLLRVEQELDEVQLRAVTRVYEQLGSPLPMHVEVGPRAGLKRRHQPPSAREAPIALTPARLLGPDTPSVVREHVANDDDFWRSYAIKAMVQSAQASRVLPESWADVSGSSCLVGTTFPPINIRSYLSLYASLVLVAPLRERLDESLRSLAITRREFVELAQRGLVRVLVPYAVERYDLDWLAELLEAAPEGVMFSRRLAAAAFEDQRRRNPLFAYPGNAFERRSVLRALARTGAQLPPESGGLVDALVEALAEHWAMAEYSLHVRGAWASVGGGLALFGSAVAKRRFNNDFFVELGGAAPHVEWAGALGSHLVPDQSKGYSSESADGFLIALVKHHPSTNHRTAVCGLRLSYG